MRKTFAPNSITIGTLIGLLVAFLVLTKTENLTLAIITFSLVGAAVTAIFWFLIKKFENAMYRGADAIEQRIENARQNRNNK